VNFETDPFYVVLSYGMIGWMSIGWEQDCFMHVTLL